MNTMLVVANRTLGGERLLHALEDRVAREPSSIHVLVPANPEPKGWSHDMFLERMRARVRLEAAIDQLDALDCAVTGQIGDPRPVDAVIDLLRERTFDEIILSTLPRGASRWLGMDVVSRLQRGVTIPVVHIESHETLLEA